MSGQVGMARTTGSPDPVLLRWWRRLALASGVISLVLGLIVLIWPKETLLILGVLLGLWLVFSGAVKVVQSALVRDRSGGARVLEALGGLFMLVIGALCLRNIAHSITLLAALVGVAWMLLGFIGVWSAFSERSHGWSRAAEGVIGALTVLGGILVIFWPAITLVVLIWVTGAWLVAIGILQLVLAWRAKLD